MRSGSTRTGTSKEHLAYDSATQRWLASAWRLAPTAV